MAGVRGIRGRELGRRLPALLLQMRERLAAARGGLAAAGNPKRAVVLYWILGTVAGAMVLGWVGASRIQSPADAAARTAAPTASPILVPVEERILSSTVVTRGTGRFGLPKVVALSPSPLKMGPGLLTTLPLRNTQIAEGEVMFTASGRPVLVLQGRAPAYRDLAPGIFGEDVRQLEEGLARLGHDPGPVDGKYDQKTSAAVGAWYTAAGWEPFGPTKSQLAHIRALERDLGDATKVKLLARSAASAAALSVQAARATAEHNNRVAQAEHAAWLADQDRLVASTRNGTPLVVASERAKAEHAETAAQAQVAATLADRARVVLDPRQPETARKAAEAQLDLARASARKTKLEAEMSVQVAERDAKLASVQLELAEAAVRSAQLAGELSVQAARDSQKVAELDARLATERANRHAAELKLAQSRLGIQIPVDEIVFIPELPARVEEIISLIGNVASGPILSVTDNRVAIDSALTLDTAPLVKVGMPVAIDEQALGIKTSGVVSRVAATPGTRGVDGYHIYFEVRVDETPVPLQGFSLRLTIPIKSTDGAVTVVPISALSLASDGQSRVQVKTDGRLEYRVVEPGLAADGFVEVDPVEGELEPGEMVVVGYENPDA